MQASLWEGLEQGRSCSFQLNFNSEAFLEEGPWSLSPPVHTDTPPATPIPAEGPGGSWGG